jgi:hypothetical protein
LGGLSNLPFNRFLQKSNTKLTIVENVAAGICLECGERYFHAKTLDEIDRLLASAHEVKGELLVEVVTL